MIFLAACSLALTACASSSGLSATVNSNSERLVQLQQDTLTLGTRFDEINGRMKNIEVKLAALDRKLAGLTDGGAIEKIGRDLLDISNKNKEMDQRVTELEIGGGRSPVMDSPSTPPPAGEVSIKVLSGTGNLGPAEVLALKLKNLGYVIKRVDIAPSRFTRSTVFYSDGFKSTAKAIATTMGPGTATKNLSWGSTFDVIAVTIK